MVSKAWRKVHGVLAMMRRRQSRTFFRLRSLPRQTIIVRIFNLSNLCYLGLRALRFYCAIIPGPASLCQTSLGRTFMGGLGLQSCTALAPPTLPRADRGE